MGGDGRLAALGSGGSVLGGEWSGEGGRAGEIGEGGIGGGGGCTKA
jgi:hypothetical protein